MQHVRGEEGGNVFLFPLEIREEDLTDGWG